jgi:hypothetical protein
MYTLQNGSDGVLLMEGRARRQIVVTRPKPMFSSLGRRRGE